MRLGTLEIPNYSLLETVNLVKKIYEQRKREEINREHIAGILGFNSRSGGFNMRLSDLKLFGLLEGKGRFKVTDIAVKATFGTNEERALALETAFKNVALWKAIYDKWGTSIPVDTFWIDLADLACIERSESKTEADRVRKLYMEDVKNILPVKPPAEPKKGDEAQKGMGARDRRKNMGDSGTSTAPYYQAQFGESSVIIADRMSLDVILGFLTNLKTVLEAKEKIAPTSGSEKQPEENSDDTAGGS